jgi:hypothetical protein
VRFVRHDTDIRKVSVVKAPILLAVGAVSAALAVLRRRRAQADAALWREATSDTSR